jgi:hypothetical protein
MSKYNNDPDNEKHKFWRWLAKNYASFESLEKLKEHSLNAGRVGTFHHVKLQLMTASMVHVTNMTPGSDNPKHGNGEWQGSRGHRVQGHEDVQGAFERDSPR